MTITHRKDMIQGNTWERCIFNEDIVFKDSYNQPAFYGGFPSVNPDNHFVSQLDESHFGFYSGQNSTGDMYMGDEYTPIFFPHNQYGVSIANGKGLFWSTNFTIGLDFGAQASPWFDREDSGVLGLRNQFTKSEFRIYNTYTDDSNYEAAVFKYDVDDNFIIAATGIGTGSNRDLIIGTSGTTIFVWNGLYLKPTTGQINVGNENYTYFSSTAQRLYINQKDYGGLVRRMFYLDQVKDDLYLAEGYGMGFAEGTGLENDDIGVCLFGAEAAPNTITQRNLTTPELPQEFQVHNFYTDTGNNSYGLLSWKRKADVFIVGTAAIGTGVLRNVRISGANVSIKPSGNGDIFVGTSSSKIGFFGATPTGQPASGSLSEANFIENAGGTAVNVDSTIGGYTVQQVAQALKDLGLLK